MAVTPSVAFHPSAWQYFHFFPRDHVVFKLLVTFVLIMCIIDTVADGMQCSQLLHISPDAHMTRKAIGATTGRLRTTLTLQS